MPTTYFNTVAAPGIEGVMACHELDVPDGQTLADIVPEGMTAQYLPAGATGKVGMVTADGGKTWAEPPAPPTPLREAYGDDLITALTDAELSAMSGGTLRDQRMLSAQRVPFRAIDDIIVRLAAVMKIDPVAWLARLPA